jgi:hypothetical protein
VRISFLNHPELQSSFICRLLVYLRHYASVLLRFCVCAVMTVQRQVLLDRNERDGDCAARSRYVVVWSH